MFKSSNPFDSQDLVEVTSFIHMHSKVEELAPGPNTLTMRPQCLPVLMFNCDNAI